MPVVKLGASREMLFHTREELICIKKAAFAWCDNVGCFIASAETAVRCCTSGMLGLRRKLLTVGISEVWGL